MIEGFDKEIDSLLRRTAKGESVQRTTFDAHLDADEISLFAENALTTKARTRAVGHLAECVKCRKILSALISFNAASESETIHAAEESDIIPAAAASTSAIPWYRRLFAFPQITFAMGALVLVFSGIIALLVMQGANESSSGTTIAQREEIRETQKGVSGADSDGEARTVETYSSDTNSASVANPNSYLTNTSTSTTANSTANSTSVNTGSTAGNIASPVTRPQQPQVERNEPASSAKQENALMSANNQDLTIAPQNKPSITAGAPLPTDAAKQPKDEEQAKESSERSRVARDGNSDNESQQVTVTGSSPSPRLAEKKAAAVKNKAGETRAIGGKTFRNVGGIWFDAAYGSQPQIMIRRGSDDYRRLDSGLR
nr:hypothetical protein [Acidobacteriota bacterium]